jgi:hypothetical protein
MILMMVAMVLVVPVALMHVPAVVVMVVVRMEEEGANRY